MSLEQLQQSGAEAKAVHARIVTRRASRRLMSFQAGGASYTLCGAPATSNDLLWRDAIKSVQQGTLAEWVTCEACRHRVAAGHA